MPAADTSPEAARHQRASIRAKTAEERVAMAMDMSQLVRQLLIQGIKRREPHLDADGLRLRVIERMHGRALARAVESSLTSPRGT